MTKGSASYENLTDSWKTKDGKFISIRSMSTSHIKNVMTILEKQTEKYKFNLPYPNLNGDMAQFQAEQEWEYLQTVGPEDIFPVYETMAEELVKRGNL